MRLSRVWGKGCMNGIVCWPCTGHPQTGSRRSCESNENTDPLFRKMFTEHVAKCSHTSNFITLTIDFSLCNKHRKILYLRFMSSCFFKQKLSFILKKRKVNWNKVTFNSTQKKFSLRRLFLWIAKWTLRAVCALLRHLYQFLGWPEGANLQESLLVFPGAMNTRITACRKTDETSPTHHPHLSYGSTGQLTQLFLSNFLSHNFKQH